MLFLFWCLYSCFVSDAIVGRLSVFSLFSVEVRVCFVGAILRNPFASFPPLLLQVI